MASQKLTSRIETEIQRLVEQHGYSEVILKDFAQFVLAKEPAKSKGKLKVKALKLPELKEAIYGHFQVQDTSALKKSSMFKMGTSGMGKLDLSKKPGWETLYRKFIGILPGEENEEDYGCVNGINIFKYDLPWKAFGLDPQLANTEDVKTAYRTLSKVYHPDTPGTGDASIFDRLTVFYKSLTEKF